MDLVTFLRARLDEDEDWGRSPECGEYQDPARVLREVEAKRRIVELHEDYETYGHDFETLALLALPYSDHEQFREEWKP